MINVSFFHSFFFCSCFPLLLILSSKELTPGFRDLTMASCATYEKKNGAYQKEKMAKQGLSRRRLNYRRRCRRPHLHAK